MSVIDFDLGPKVVSRNCKFDYTYNQTVPPVILDGGRQLLLANFHGPRSLKCSSQNGGLAKPAPEHTYAVVPRDFLCDHQLDLEHASVLCQLSSCNHNSSNHLVSKLKLNMKTKPRVFNVRLFGDIKGPLDQPTHLKEIISLIDDTGCRERSQTQTKSKEEPILTKTQSNILVIACTFLATLVGVELVFLAVRHVKLKALVAGLALVTAAPVTEARNSHAATKEPLIMPDKVICTDPILTGFATAVSIAALFIFVYMQCHGLSWLYGYKYHRYCTFFMFVYNNDRYAPIKIKHLKGHDLEEILWVPNFLLYLSNMLSMIGV